MRITEEGKENLTNIRMFKYRGEVYTVVDLKEDIKGFRGCCKKMYGIKCCIINANLSSMEKQRVLHRLIKEKHLVKG